MSSNYNNICRICMKEGDDFTNLSSTDTDFIEFNVKLYFCVPTVNIDNETFPQRLCYDCVSHLQIAYKFKQTCLNSTFVLNELLKRESDEKCETDIDELVTNNEMVTDVIIEEINRIKQEVDESDTENTLHEMTSPFAESLSTAHSENILTSKKFITDKYFCTICELEFDDDEYSNHKYVHENDGELKCPVCLREFDSGDLRRFFKHYCVSKSDSLLLDCKSCSRKFKTTQALASHKRVHTDETKMYKCNVCGLFFSTARRLNWHYKNGVHKDKNTNKLKIFDVND